MAMGSLRHWGAPLVAIATLSCCTVSKPVAETAADASNAIRPALQSINSTAMLDHIKVLASDEFEGRAPGTRGEALTVDYLVAQFKGLGLQPGNPDGTYTQRVPLVGYTSLPAATIDRRGQKTGLRYPGDFVAWSPHREPEVSIENSDLVFVGYGVIAPEYGWDDYKGMDLTGKTLVMLINDPPIPDPNDPSGLDDKMFKGNAMTYYGRWTYKYEMAAKLGAAAAFIVHETKPAAYPYSVVVNSWARENFAIKASGHNPNFPLVPAWIHLDRARQLFAAGGYDFDALKKAALRKDFRPIPLGTKINLRVHNTWREVESHNVLAKIEDTDPALKNEYVIYTAHWDHFGRDEKLPGTKHDQIYHGALDNASGIATLLELARSFTKLAVPPKRSILFIATTAEEQGLLGAAYYVKNPLYPLSRTLADINIDGINPWGRTRDVEILGDGNSTLDDMVASLAAKQGRVARAESRPELGLFYRADHFEFAKQGVPVVYMKSRTQYIGKPGDYAKQKVDEYIVHDYHQVTDTVREDWDLSGAVEDTQLLLELGYRIAQADTYPQWKAGSEFKAKRDATLGADR